MDKPELQTIQYLDIDAALSWLDENGHPGIHHRMWGEMCACGVNNGGTTKLWFNPQMPPDESEYTMEQYKEDLATIKKEFNIPGDYVTCMTKW